MGYKKLSNEQEKQLVEEYIQGTPVKELMAKYNFKTKKSITDKVKKYYPNDYENLITQARDNRKGYSYSLERITSPFDAYLVGLLLTDGYLLTDRNGVGLDMTDEDVIKFVADTIGTDYKSYNKEGVKTHYRVIINTNGISEQVKRFGIVQNKSLIIPQPSLLKEEEIFLPYIIRGIIDGDGCVSPTAYGSAQFFIVTMSEQFALWLKDILTNRFFMNDIHIRQADSGIYRIETADQFNIYKLIAAVYNKPFGMQRKYKLLRKTFRDYNRVSLLEENGIVQTTTID